MIRFLIYIFAMYILFKKLYQVIINYKEYYSINRLNLNLLKVSSEKKRNQGLMNRKNRLKENEGMLFEYDKPTKIKMWMKNTYIPLDIIFLDKRFRVIEYKENLKPHDITTDYSSNKKYKYAIEINSGTIKKRNIKEGTLIIPKYIKKLN
jgi:uncharacterized membrane protein (UPF0127 family)